MKKLLIFLNLFFLCSKYSFSQIQKETAIDLKGKKFYVLSEHITFENNSFLTQTFNSLFIWEKEKVTRIIFKIEKRLTKNEYAKVLKTNIDSIFYPVKNYDLFLQYPNDSPSTFQILLDGDSLKRINLPTELNYKLKSIVEINKWNKLNNPNADLLTIDVISDDDSYKLERNAKRPTRFANNLPIVFKMPHQDSFFKVKPFRFDVYVKKDEDTPSPNSAETVNTYYLLSTISLMDESFLSSKMRDLNNDVDKELKFTNDFISYHTPLQLCAAFPTSPKNTLKWLGAFSKIADVPKGNQLETTDCRGFAPFNRFLETSINSFFTDSVSVSISEGIEKYQFCQNCHDSQKTQLRRIYQHCPFIFKLNSPNWLQQNWVYLFRQRNHLFFKSEVIIPQNECGDPKFWQMFVPGVGYWLSNVALDDMGIFFIPDKSRQFFLINGKTIDNQ